MKIGDIISKEGYTFRIEKADISERPFKVRCIETGETNDNATDYNGAIELYIRPIINMKKELEEKKLRDSQDIQIVKQIFERALLKEKLNNATQILDEQVCPKIAGQITRVKRDKSDRTQIYKTENFTVKAICEYGFPRGITKIDIESKE